MFHLQKKLYLLLHSEITELYIAHSLRAFAVSMVSVFIPIFFLEKGYSLVEVMMFYIIHSVLVLTTIHWFIKFAAEKGLKKSIIISLPLSILFFFILFNYDTLTPIIGNRPYLALASVVGIVANMFYWMGLHMDFAKMHETKNAAKQVSWLHALSIIFSILGPLLGAMFISTAGFGITFIVVIAILLLAAIPLLVTKDIHEPFDVHIKNIFSPKERKRHYPYFGEGFRQRAAGILWPIMLFLLAINIKEIGGLYSFTNALLAVVTIYVGRVTTDMNKHKILNWGVIFHSISLVLRTVLKTVVTIAAVQGLGAISFSMMKTPYDSTHYKKSRNQGIAHTIFAREIYLHIGLFVCSLFLIAVYYIVGEAIQALMLTIITAAIFSFLMTRIKED